MPRCNLTLSSTRAGLSFRSVLAALTFRSTLAVVCLLATPAGWAQESIVILDESGAGDFREASSGNATPPDSLLLVDGSKLPLESEHAYSGESSGLLEYRHTDGAWRMAIHREASSVFDLTGFDSLLVFLNGPSQLEGGELPRIFLRDADGAETESAWLAPVYDVEVDPAGSGFTSGSTTDAITEVEYVDVLPSNARRPGYPEDLEIRFADGPVDTSEAGIGVPAKPAHFEIVTQSGLRPTFRFLDQDDDGTLSRTDEFIEVRLPEAEDSDRQVTTWRFTLANGSDPLNPPGAGDVYELALTYDEFTLDADPETWQRVSLPLDDVTGVSTDDGAFDPTAVESVVFRHGGRNPEMRTLWFDQLLVTKNDDEAFLDMIQRDTFDFFWFEANPSNGLVRDRSTGNYSSIAAVGFGLSALTVGIDRGWVSLEEGRERVLTTLEFFWNAPQSSAETNVTGYKGFFYHFLNMDTGRRSGTTELSTIDTALLLGGVLHVREYFVEDEEIRSLADSIYHRVDWTWMQFRHPNNPTSAINHGWKPETGFLNHDWIGYNEAMLLYILALGSPTHPVPPEAWDAWVSGYSGQWRTEYGYTYLIFPPLFGHQYSHVWIDFRGIQDAYMRDRGIDYFENSRRATLAQRAYHIANPRGWPNYSKDEWGLTASDTPDGYRARGAPPAQNDDGTLVPTAPGGSIVFTPEESIAALRTMYQKYGSQLYGKYGFRDAYNVSRGWVAEAYLGIDQGPILLMIENHRTETIWDVAMRNESIRRGLERAGFTGVGLSAPDDEIPDGDAPQTPLMLSIYPNPVGDDAQIEYVTQRADAVRLSLYDVLGREVLRIADAFKTAGRHEDRVTTAGLSSGLYILVLECGEERTTRLVTKVE